MLFYKPAGIHTHRSEFSRHEKGFQEIIQERINTRLYTVHRLDRAAAGLVLFATSSQSAMILGSLFRDHQIRKTYHILVRGWMETTTCSKPLRDDIDQKMRSAETQFFTQRRYRIPIPFGSYPEVRLSWCRVVPTTGRRHQIRLHAKSLAHPIIGDTRHGDIKLSRLVSELVGVRRLWLVSTGLAFVYPVSGKSYCFEASLDDEIKHGLKSLEIYAIEEGGHSELQSVLS